MPEPSDGRRSQNILTLGVICISILGVYIYFSSATNAGRREAELTKVIHNYEESVFLKKVEIYKEEVKRKEAELELERQERARLTEELQKANTQIDTANEELEKANKIIEDEALAISEWKAKTTQLESDFFNVRKERDELRTKNTELTEYAKKKDTALKLVMESLEKTNNDRDKAETLKNMAEKELAEQQQQSAS